MLCTLSNVIHNILRIGLAHRSEKDGGLAEKDQQRLEIDIKVYNTT